MRATSQDDAFDEETQVTEEDERWRKSRAGVVLLYQLVTLKLPDCVGIILHALERVAEGTNTVKCKGFDSITKPACCQILDFFTFE